MRKYSGTLNGHRPWAMQQNQRGPTCGLTAISVAYRILTGWTIFATKGEYRNFMQTNKRVTVNKGQENAYVLRKAAKDKGFTAAGEIVNADDLAKLVNICQGVRARVNVVEGSWRRNVGSSFVRAVREDIKKGIVPVVMFYVNVMGRGRYAPDRSGLFQHWIPLFAVEENRKWISLEVKNLTRKAPLKLPQGNVPKNLMVMWNWGNPWLVDGEALGKSSALSLDWTTTPRMWDKRDAQSGDMGWKEINPSKKEYRRNVRHDKVRYTRRERIRALDKRGYVQCYAV